MGVALLAWREEKENNAGEEAFLAGISWEVALGFDPPGTWLAKACSDRDSKFPVSFYAGTHTSLTLEAASPTSTSGGFYISREGSRGSVLLDAMGGVVREALVRWGRHVLTAFSYSDLPQ